MGYVLNTERMRVVRKNERGVVVGRKRFTKGDRVTEADLEHYEGRFDALVASGALVDEDAETEVFDSSHPVVTGGGVGNAVGGTTPDTDLGNEAGEDEGNDEEGESEGDTEDEADEFDPEKVEDFGTMDYPTLQRLAKARTGNGSGGKDDLVARLEAHAAENR